MKRFTHGLLLLAIAAHTAFAQEETRPKIPPAFPESTTHTQPELMEALPPPVAVPHGHARTQLPAPAFPNPTEASANWVLKRMATSKDAAIRKRASEAWPVSETTVEEMNALVYALVDHDDLVRQGAIDRLYRLEANQVFGYVMRILVGGAKTQVYAIDAALPLLEPVLTPLMKETLRTELETPQHRRIAAYCLGRMKALNAVETLGQYAVEQDTDLSRACADALYAIGTSETTPYWMQLLAHDDMYCRRLAARALAYLGGPNAVDRLKIMLLDDNEELTLQTETLQAFGNRPPKMLLPLLVDVLEHNPQLRPAALRMLRTYTDEDFGRDISAWRNWVNRLMKSTPPPVVPSE